MKKDIQLIINHSEITAGTRGASLGPEALKVVSRQKQDGFFNRFPTVNIENENHLLDQEVKHPHAKRGEGLVKIYERLNNHVSTILKNGKFPLVLAGDHGSAGGTIAGIKTAFPNKRLGVIWIDAHGDLHTPFTTPTGNMHGMPLATALNEDNLHCRKNEVDDATEKVWSQLKSMGDIHPKIQPEDLVFIGVRDTEAQEEFLMNQLAIKNFEVAEVREKGVQNIVDKTKDLLKECDIVYVSFDVDSMDPEMTSHGTGTPVKNGLSVQEAQAFLIEFSKWEKLVCLEMVEINPCLDEKTNKMAEVSYDLLQDIVENLTK